MSYVRHHYRKHSPVRGHFRRRPAFLIDENLPPSIVHSLNRKGYDAQHVHEIFRQGISDQQLRDYAEKRNLVIITRDAEFPEPGYAGDRVLVIDVPNKSSEQEILKRIEQLGWK